MTQEELSMNKYFGTNSQFSDMNFWRGLHA